MEDSFELPVEYRGEQYMFKAVLVVYGFTHKINVDIDGQAVAFEPDEEGNYRAIVNAVDLEKNKHVDISLLKKIAESLEAILK
jgi:hypothetical protein